MSTLPRLTHVQRVALNPNYAPRLAAKCKPRATRHTLLRTCSVVFYPNSPITVHTIEGYTRNVSTGGIGLRVPRVFLPGDPIEVGLTKQDELFYLAGLVTFCRHVQGMHHEVGVRLLTAGHERIFRTDIAHPGTIPEWVLQALYTRQCGDPSDAPGAVRALRSAGGTAA